MGLLEKLKGGVADIKTGVVGTGAEDKRMGVLEVVAEDKRIGEVETMDPHSLISEALGEMPVNVILGKSSSLELESTQAYNI